MNLKKIKLMFGFLILCASGLSANDSKNEMLSTALSGIRLTSSYSNAFNLYNMDKYSKNSFGGNLAFEYTLLPEIEKNLDLGFYGKSTVQNFVPCNVQLIQLLSYGFSGGIFTQYNVPNDFSLLMSLGLGFLISDIDFISAEKGKVNDIYYDFMLEADLNLRKVILKTRNFNLLGFAGCHCAFYNEKTENFMNIGPTFGVAVDFNPVAKKTGAKK